MHLQSPAQGVDGVFDDALAAARRERRRGVEFVEHDREPGPPRIGFDLGEPGAFGRQLQDVVGRCDRCRIRSWRSLQTVRYPPSTATVAAGDVRRGIAAQEQHRAGESSAVPPRPIGVWRRSRRPCISGMSSAGCVIRVSISPGATALTRMPSSDPAAGEVPREGDQARLRRAVGGHVDRRYGTPTSTPC